MLEIGGRKNFDEEKFLTRKIIMTQVVVECSSCWHATFWRLVRQRSGTCTDSTSTPRSRSWDGSLTSCTPTGGHITISTPQPYAVCHYNTTILPQPVSQELFCFATKSIVQLNENYVSPFCPQYYRVISPSSCRLQARRKASNTNWEPSNGFGEGRRLVNPTHSFCGQF